MKHFLILFFSLFYLTTSIAIAEEPIDVGTEVDEREIEEEDDDDDSSVLGAIVFYVPNRVFDLFDIFRLRARVGPGVAIGARATKLIQGNIGGYSTVYVGLPGPRQKPTIPLPAGLEMYAGVALSMAEIEASPFGPDYSPTEFGAHAHLALVGLDVGIDPYEIVDFALGLFFIDPVGDDF